MSNVRFIFCLFASLVALQIQSIHSDTPSQPQSQSPPDASIRGSGREEIAFVDNDRRHDLYRRYENRNNWDYRQNWEYHQDDYLRGDMSLQEGPNPPGYHDNRSYQNYYYDNQPTRSYDYRHDNYNHTPDPNTQPSKSWDYRQNWRYHQDSYLRGENPTAYRKRVQDEQEKRKLAREQQAKQRKEQQEKYLAELSRKKSNNSATTTTKTTDKANDNSNAKKSNGISTSEAYIHNTI